ncbi:MAG TPA: glycosyl hydrolase family 39 [Acidobacteriaceae bacterium]
MLWKSTLGLFGLVTSLAMFTAPQLSAQQTIQIDAHAASTPFPHFWEEMFGSGRAALALRQSYRDDLHAVKSVTAIRYMRFHAILQDELGVYNEDEHGQPFYNFTYVDQIYDALLAQGVRPVVEISFMPRKLAFNPDALHPFWYKQNVSPPKSMQRWDDLMKAFAQHLVDRYGIDEVAQWYFEVWNEPNIDFWGGIPRQESYFDLYAHTAKALKTVSPRLRVGGPSTAAAAWIPDFLKFTSENKVPVDFVSSHGYDDEPVKRLIGTDDVIPEEDRTCAAVAHVRQQIDASANPHLPLLWTEWNVPGAHRLRDTPYVGPALAEAIRTCDGHVDYLSFWTFSDVFEEGGVARKPFDGQFGLRATGGINKASYYDFALLHRLGDQRIANATKNAIVTRLADGSLEVAVWNPVENEVSGGPQEVSLQFSGIAKNAATSLDCVDDNHSNPVKLWQAMGSPVYPKPEQVEQINRDSALPAPERHPLANGAIHLHLERNALCLLHVGGAEQAHSNKLE